MCINSEKTDNQIEIGEKSFQNLQWASHDPQLQRIWISMNSFKVFILGCGSCGPHCSLYSYLTFITPSAFAFKVICSSWDAFRIFSTWFVVTHILSFTLVFDRIHNKICFKFALIWTDSIGTNSICTARFTSLAFINIIAVKTVTLFGFKFFAQEIPYPTSYRILLILRSGCFYSI